MGAGSVGKGTTAHARRTEFKSLAFIFFKKFSMVHIPATPQSGAEVGRFLELATSQPNKMASLWLSKIVSKIRFRVIKEDI